MTEHGIEDTAVTVRRGRGLAVASVSVGAVSLLLAVSVWVAWVLVRPRFGGMPVFAWIGEVFVLVLGALWFLAVLAGVLAIVFGLTGGGRDRGGDLARGGALLGLGAWSSASPVRPCSR